MSKGTKIAEGLRKYNRDVRAKQYALSYADYQNKVAMSQLHYIADMQRVYIATSTYGNTLAGLLDRIKWQVKYQ